MAARIVMIVAAVALAGCAGSDEPAIPESALPSIVLKLGDLGAPFTQFDEGRQSRAESTSRFRSDPIRFERIGGWKARFRRPGSPATSGPLVVESRADVFADEEGARHDLAAYRRELRNMAAESGGRVLTAPALGDEAVAITFRDDRVRFYRIAWRLKNGTALVFANGFDGRFALAEALALARKQQRRLQQAVR